MYLEDNFDQSIGPLPRFPVRLPTLPNFTSLGERASSWLLIVQNLDVCCPCGHLLNLVYHSSNLWDTDKGDGLIWWATWVNQFQIISCTSNQHTAIEQPFLSRYTIWTSSISANNDYSPTQKGWWISQASHCIYGRAIKWVKAVD